MSDHHTIMDRLKSLFGITRQPPQNEFRNPIWGDDDDDEDELFERHSNITFSDHFQIHSDINKQIEDMMRSFGGLFNDLNTFIGEDLFSNAPQSQVLPPSEQGEPDTTDSNRLRSYFLKPGYHKPIFDTQPHADSDLDGKVSSQDIHKLLSKKGPETTTTGSQYNPTFFSKTIITTKITKPDGSIETHRLVKDGNEITEETTTTGPINPILSNYTGLDNAHHSIINKIVSEFASIWSNIH